MYCILSSKIEPLFLFLLVSEYLVRQEADLFESCKSTDKFPWHSFHATDKLPEPPPARSTMPFFRFNGGV